MLQCENPLNAIRSGLCRRRCDGHILSYSQNEIEAQHGFLLLSEVDPETTQINDLDCVLLGLEFGSSIIRTLPGLYDISGYEILS